MPRKIATVIFVLLAVFSLPAKEGKYDERGNLLQVSGDDRKFYAGAEAAISRHIEEGLDHTKGEYSVAYTTLGGSVTAQYHFSDFYFDAGVGMMKLLALSVNSVKIDLSNRTQWHLPFYAHAFYKLDPMFALGAGMTHLTELSMYVDSQKVPNSSYNHIFIDLAAQVSVPLDHSFVLTFTPVIGINVIPGRQNVYSVGDMLHLRLQFNVGILFRLA
jgi:hypothetical protein